MRPNLAPHSLLLKLYACSLKHRDHGGHRALYEKISVSSVVMFFQPKYAAAEAPHPTGQDPHPMKGGFQAFWGGFLGRGLGDVIPHVRYVKCREKGIVGAGKSPYLCTDKLNVEH